MPLVLPSPPAAAATPAHRPRPHTPPKCKDPELQALALPRFPAAPPFPTTHQHHRQPRAAAADLPRAPWLKPPVAACKRYTYRVVLKTWYIASFS